MTICDSMGMQWAIEPQTDKIKAMILMPKTRNVMWKGMEGGDYTNKYCHDVLLGEQ